MMQTMAGAHAKQPEAQEAPETQSSQGSQAPTEPSGSSGGPEQPETSKARSLASWIVVIALAVAAALCVRLFIVAPYSIPSGSMEETLMPGDYILAERLTYGSSDPQVGDIVTFKDPDDPSKTLIKRVIATEGQTVELNRGRVMVDGALVDEPYTEGKPGFPIETKDGDSQVEYPYTVPEGHIWVMGDNRTNSIDSRAYGAVPIENVTGKAFFRLWPLASFGPL